MVRARRRPLDAWPVADAAGLCGMIRNTDLDTAVAKGAESKSLADLLAIFAYALVSCLVVNDAVKVVMIKWRVLRHVDRG
jgi:hypothetical protein